MCREYFSQDVQIQNLATQIYSNVDFVWMLNGGTTLSMGWTPETRFLPFRWDTYSELMMLYLLAIGSPTHRFPHQSGRHGRVRHSRIRVWLTSLPAHRCSRTSIRTRGLISGTKKTHSRTISRTRLPRQWCTGSSAFRLRRSSRITAAISGASPLRILQTGTKRGAGLQRWGPLMAPCALCNGGIASVVPAETIHVLRWIRGHYPQAWQRFGYVDAFNPLTGWYDGDVIGIDVGFLS